VDPKVVANLAGEQPRRDDRASQCNHLVEHLEPAAPDGTPAATSAHHRAAVGEPGFVAADRYGSGPSSGATTAIAVGFECGWRPPSHVRNAVESLGGRPGQFVWWRQHYQAGQAPDCFRQLQCYWNFSKPRWRLRSYRLEHKQPRSVGGRPWAFHGVGCGQPATQRPR